MDYSRVKCEDFTSVCRGPAPISFQTNTLTSQNQREACKKDGNWKDGRIKGIEHG